MLCRLYCKKKIIGCIVKKFTGCIVKKFTGCKKFLKKKFSDATANIFTIYCFYL